MKLFTQQQLQEHAYSSTIFRRGKGYQSPSRIQMFSYEKTNKQTGVIQAVVRGSSEYITSITYNPENGDIITSECDCPYGPTCKHIIGLGLYALNHPDQIVETATHEEITDNTSIFADFEKISSPHKQKPSKKLQKNQGVMPQFAVSQDADSRQTRYFLTLLNPPLHQDFIVNNASSAFHKNIWSMFIKEMYSPNNNSTNNNSNTKNRELTPAIIDRYIPFLVEQQVLQTADQKSLELANEPPQLSLELHKAKNFTITLGKGHLLVGQTSAFLYDGQRLFTLDLNSIPLSFLQQLAQDGGWQVSQFDQKQVEDFLLPLLTSQGHHITEYGELRGDEIIDEYNVIFLFDKDAGRDRFFHLSIFFEAETSKGSQRINFLTYVHKYLDEYDYEYDYDYYDYWREETYEDFLESDPSNLGLQQAGDDLLIDLENDIYCKWDHNLACQIVKDILTGNSQSYDDRAADSLMLDIKGPRLKTIFKKIIKAVKQNDNWHLERGEGLENFNFKKKKVNVQFEFDDLDTDQGFFDFDLECQLDGKKLSLEDLKQKLENYDNTMNFGQGEYVEITNLDQIKKLLDVLDSTKATSPKNQRFQANLWQTPEIMGFIEAHKNIDFTGTDSFKNFLKETKTGKPLETISLPHGSKKILRDYQIKGIEWGHFLRKYHFGGILADDMGLGKTLQVLTLLASIKAKTPSLVVCPKTLIYNWKAEQEKFFPKLKVLIIDGVSSMRKTQLHTKIIQEYDLVLTSYPLIQKDIALYLKIKKSFEYVILDEAQHIKNHKTKTAQAAKILPARHRLAMTGTAIENGCSDLWSIFDFLMPGFLGNHKSFRSNYDLPISRHNQKEPLKLLTQKVKPFLLRRAKETVLTELPPKIEQNMFCELSHDQLLLYTHTVAQIKETLFQKVETKGFDRSRIEILSALTKLRQICDHPGMVDPTHITSDSGKCDLLKELLHECFNSGKKVLVFSSFVKALRIIEADLQKEGIQYSYLDGQTKNRQKQIQQFQENENISVFLISLKAGGTGLNLTSADTVIPFDPWWNPMVEMQAMDRAHRMGQTKTVNVYSLLTKGTLEEKMLGVKAKKKKMFEAVMGENQDYLQKLTWEDIQGLFEMNF